MKLEVIVFAGLAMSCGTVRQDVDTGAADVTADVQMPLSADETALVGTWSFSTSLTADTLRRWTLTLRADRTAARIITQEATRCGVATTFTIETRWRVTGAMLVLDPAQCTTTPSATCSDPTGTPMWCIGPDGGGSFSYSLSGNMLTLTGSASGIGTYTR